ncbi:PREDICTED: LOW QUALITY PROTEIN: inositol polyphosphate 5-phosphatase K [Thamnophis sirtalis]|uniref:LOW QUALITY PROTEIN: inositol polyphosphate 5-phosphatase K n=1 Tax=Thamnophis sirtalis TaxID=35019 RepID=A0A6I9XW38_9SAUR|nr:PREDICTED: LOW QUALITY PROTEIN: inositol polyphosphate 5-phosphatase K [Thamnophis sirtalis]
MALHLWRREFSATNAGIRKPFFSVAALLGLGAPEPPVDLYAIGLQEVNCRILSFISDLAFEDPWTASLTAALAPLGYVRVSSIRMQGILLLLFSKQAHLPFIRGVRSQFTRTGLHGYWGNKGGVSIRLSLYGHSVCFLNCHLPAHQENAKQRLDDFEHILEMQQFREDLPLRPGPRLNMAKKKLFFLQEFSEGPLKFKPTYKFDLHSDEYDTSEKKRKPAWTDRILWRVKCLPCSKPKEVPREGGVSLSLGSYTSHMDYDISDHKPVTGTFELKVQPLQEEPLVVLCPVGTWSAGQDATVSYVTAPEFASSPWDWIGLYRVSFRHVNDYVTYVWVQDNEISAEDGAKQVYLGAEGLPNAGGEFLLGYYSNALRSLVGLSQPVQVQPSPKSAEQQAGWSGASSAERLPCERPPCDF